MADKYVNKVIYNGNVLIDISGDTIAADKLLAGETAHGRDGAPIVGTCPYDMDTSNETATADEILVGKRAGVHGVSVAGSMPNNGAVTGDISDKNGVYTIPRGYHDGSGKSKISDTEKAKLIPENIRSGITLLGVEGSMSGTEGIRAETKHVTPSAAQQELIPDSASGYNYIGSVIVAPIPYVSVDNEFGGQTVTIG